jgi:hypothetical protein
MFSLKIGKKIPATITLAVFVQEGHTFRNAVGSNTYFSRQVTCQLYSPRLCPISLYSASSTSDLCGDTKRDINQGLRMANLFFALLQLLLENNCINALYVER